MNNEPDFNPEDEQSINAALEREFVRPAATFQNRPLWPFTPGSKALYSMSLSEQDTRLYRVLSFIFTHIRRDERLSATPDQAKNMELDLARNVVPLIWDNLSLYRMKVLSLCDSMTDADISAAASIVEHELQLESATEIAATPPDIGPHAQKKSEATPRQRSGGKHSRRQKNSG